METQFYIQYHKADDFGYPDALQGYKRWAYTKKKVAEKSLGSYCFLVVGKTENKIKNYYLWAFFHTESVIKNEEGDYEVYGTGVNLSRPILLNNLSHFGSFSTAEYKNFGLGYTNITSSPFSKELFSLSSEMNNLVTVTKSNKPSRLIFRELNPDQVWDVILTQAKKAFLTKDTWESPKQKRKYSIKTVPEENIIISREGPHQDSVFGKDFVTARINQINAGNGFISRKDWDGHVAKMAAIVHLHPQLHWKDDFETIVVEEASKPKYKDFGEAPDDNPNELNYFARKVRKGQKKFRDILLRAYQNKCCISESEVEAILEACHISAHSINGNNKTENGLLLRSDIHDLFDLGLIQIDPNNFIINIHPQLQKSEYWQFNGKKILDRADNIKPGAQYLVIKWNEKSW